MEKKKVNKQPTIRVGEIYPLQITGLTQQGQGVGHIDGLTVFVDGGVPGDQLSVKITLVKHHYAVAQMLECPVPSPDRDTVACPYYADCGGCQFQHILYEEQLKYKRQIVVDALSRIGGIQTAECLTRKTVGMDYPWRYRNKAQYKTDYQGVGFYAPKSHAIIPIDDCLTQPESCRNVIAAIQSLIRQGILQPYDEKKQSGILRGVVQRRNQIGDEMITLILAQDQPDLYRTLIRHFTQNIPGLKSLNININSERGNAIFGQETRCIQGTPTITEHLNDLAFELSPRSFFQVNTVQTTVLYDLVKTAAGCDGHQIVYDLFCGTGTIGLYLARSAKKIIGIEIIAEAIDNALQNAERNGINNAVFYCGKVEDLLEEAVRENGMPDVVVVDPPRKGLDAHIIDLIDEYHVPKVVYVSCNPATLARDTALMIEKGYEMEYAIPVDMFAHTGHVETVCLLSRNN